MSGDTATVPAAGVVLWRGEGVDREIALVHRPKYDDWSLPKGKAEPGELLSVTAVRECLEETGFSGVLGPCLGRLRYEVTGPDGPAPKTVDYWGMQVLGGAFTANAEVDRIVWLPPARALRELTRPADRGPVRRLAAFPMATTSLLLVRHGRAGERRRWKGPDELRPLDAVGEAQAEALAALGAPYGVQSVVAALPVRCQQTVTPLATGLGLAVETVDALGEEQHRREPAAMAAALTSWGSTGRVVAACSQGGAIPESIEALRDPDTVVTRKVRARKGSVWVLSFAAGRLAAADYLDRVAPAR